MSEPASAPAPHPDLSLVAALERHSAFAWPAPEVVAINGWELRFTPGSRSRRVNCLTPVAPVAGRFAETLSVARRVCAGRGASCTVRLQPLGGDEPRDHLLGLGLSPEGATSVQVAPLGGMGPPPEGVRLVDGFDPAWVEAMGLAHHDSPEEREAIARVLSRVSEGQVLGTVMDGASPAAFGRTVVRDGLAGVFHVVTADGHRRRGHARRLLRALLAAARARGAMRAYLQVTLANAEARPLYESLGFREVYVYDYWAA